MISTQSRISYESDRFMTISNTTKNLKCTEDQRLVRSTFSKNMVRYYSTITFGVGLAAMIPVGVFLREVLPYALGIFGGLMFFVQLISGYTFCQYRSPFSRVEEPFWFWFSILSTTAIFGYFTFKMLSTFA